MENLVKVIQNPYNNEEFAVVNNHESLYHETQIEDIAEHYNGLERELLNQFESVGCKIEYYSHRQDKYVTKQDYINHFINYDSDKEYISPFTTCNKTQAETMASIINVE